MIARGSPGRWNDVAALQSLGDVNGFLSGGVSCAGLENKGVLQQVDSPAVMYSRPANVFVAGFIGTPAMNLLEAEKSESGAVIGDVVLPVTREVLEASSGSTITVGIRPEDLQLSDHGIPLRVEMVEVLGADAFVYGQPDGRRSGEPIIIRVPSASAPRKRETVRAQPDPEKLHLFDSGSGIRL